MSPTRQRTALFIIAAIAVTGITACGPSSENASDTGGCSPSKEKVVLDYWTWLPGADGAVAAFNESHPDIEVKLNAIPGGSDAYQAYFNALKAENQPDLAMIEYDHLPNFRVSDYLQDISPCEPVAGLKDRVVSWTYNQVTLGTDGVYATPTDIGPLALYYRTDIFEQYGLTVPKTWDEFRADAEKLHAANPQISMTSFTPQDATLLQGLAWQAGAKPYSYRDGTFVLDMTSEPMKRVADYWQELIDSELVSTSLQPFSPALYSAWANGTVASTVGASWLYEILQQNAGDTSGKWAVAELPAWNATPSGANYGGAATAVLKGTKHPYEASVFADWLSTSPEANKIIFGDGGTAASLAWADSGAYGQPSEFFGGQKIFQTFQTAAQNTDTTFQWAPDQANLNNYLQDALADAVSGNSTIEEAFTLTETKVEADLKNQSIPVETE